MPESPLIKRMGERYVAIPITLYDHSYKHWFGILGSGDNRQNHNVEESKV